MEKRMTEERKTVIMFLGKKLFEFESMEQWVNKATSWYRNCGTKDYVTVDSFGRICTRGAHFQRAKDDGAYPIRVYEI